MGYDFIGRISFLPGVQLRQLEILQRALDVEMIKALDRPPFRLWGQQMKVVSQLSETNWKWIGFDKMFSS